MNILKRAAILVHYDKDDMLDPYIIPYLASLRASTSHLVFVSTAKLDISQVKILYTYCDSVIIRENVGYDFMSYKMGLESFDYTQYDELLICNDSVYGPLYPLETLFNTMRTNTCDFWGITDNVDMGYHIQSYFILIKKNALQSIQFQEFWENVSILYEKDEIIRQYEVGFTQTLVQAGFTPAISTNFQASNTQKMTIVLRKFTPRKIVKKLHSIVNDKAKLVRIGKINNTHYFWKELLLSAQMPFIKIELLRDNPMDVDIKDYTHIIQQISTYDTQLIANHLTRIKKVK